jgi:hypothetical protein
VINGCRASEAYRASFKPKNCKPKTINEKASRVLNTGKIKARIEEIQQEANKKYEVSRDYLNETLQFVLKESIKGEDKNLDLVRKAAMDLAKLNGLIVDIGKLDVNATVVQMGEIKLGDKKLEFNV